MDLGALESKLLNYRPAGPLSQEFAEGFVWPHYGRYSITEVPSAVAVMLGADPVPGTVPLDASLWQPLADGVQRVVLVLIDAAGWRRLQDAMQHDPNLPLHRWRDAGILAPLTSTFPSTTAVALTTLWTGMPPAQHGMIGSRAFLREYGILSHLLWFTPAAANTRWLLLDWGLEPEDFLPVAGFAEHLERAGVPTYVFIHRGMEESALSRLHYRGVAEVEGFLGIADMFVSLRELLEERAGERFYAAAYWFVIDALSHHYGPHDDRWVGELRSIMYGLERELVSQLSAEARRGTLLILMADHGQRRVHKSTTVYLKHHPELRDLLRMDPGGELRAPYLYTLDREAVRSYMVQHLSEAFACLYGEEVIESGLLGSGEPMSEVPHRLGDLVSPARGDYQMHWMRKERPVFGRHGGLSPEEMLVPWLAMRLDQ